MLFIQIAQKLEGTLVRLEVEEGDRGGVIKYNPMQFAASGLL